MHVEYDIYKKRMDFTPLLKGLPKDRDPCPHWGIVLKGQMRVKYDGKEEIVKAGETCYMPPGHTGIVEAGTNQYSTTVETVKLSN
jgi:quercetin dioxygenase-like cupin family protein